MGRLTTHVLDTANGMPAAGVSIKLYRLGEETPLAATSTNTDGRSPEPLLEGDAFQVGQYRLIFQVADYYRAQGLALPDPPFLDGVELVFGISATDQHYHVPLLVSPYGYSTYRGS